MNRHSIIGALTGAAAVLLSGSASALPFQPGEEVLLRVSYLAINVGTMKITIGDQAVDSGVRVWPIAMRARTSGLTDAVYRIDEQFITKFDPVTKRSIGSETHENSGRYHSVETVHFLDGKAEIHSEAKGVSHDREVPTPLGATDILAAVYALRDRTFQPGVVERIPIFTGYKNWEMLVTEVGREKIETDAGVYDTVVLRCRTLFTGKFATQHDLTLWVSTGPHRIPVRIEAPFVLGTMRAELAAYRPGPLPGN